MPNFDYTSRILTKEYLKKLESWEKELIEIKKRKFKDEKIDGFEKTLPRYNRGNLILIIDVDTFSNYSPPFFLDTEKDDEYRLHLYNHEKKVFSILRNSRNRNTGWTSYVAINKEGIKEDIEPLSIEILRKKDNLLHEENPDYIWLPHPSGLRSYKEFLVHVYPKRIKKLERILDKHYNSIK